MVATVMAYPPKNDATSSPQVSPPTSSPRRSSGRRGRRAHLQPLWPIGIPLPPPLPITAAPAPPQVAMGEPATIVGDSGKPYARVNDRADGQPESVTVQPPPGAAPDPGIGGKGVSMASGGSINGYLNGAIYDPTRPQQPPPAPVYSGGGIMGAVTRPVATMASGGGSSPAPRFDSAAFQRLLDLERSQGYSQLDAQGQVINAGQTYLDAQGNVVDAATGVLRAQGGANAANRNVVMAEAGTLPAQQGVINASRNVVGAQRAQLGVDRNVISLQEEQNQGRAADTAKIRNAAANVDDKAAVAQESLLRGEQDKAYNRLGIAPPVSIDTPAGAGLMATPPGTRPTLIDAEGRARAAASNNEQDRQIQLTSAKLAQAMSGTNVDEMRLAAQEAGLTLDEARMVVSQAQQQAKLAGLDVNDAELAKSFAGVLADRAQLAKESAGLGLDQTRLDSARTKAQIQDLNAPSDQGYELYTDPVTLERSWKTPAEIDQLKYNYEQGLQDQRFAGNLSRQESQQQQRTAYQNNLRPLAGADEQTFLQMLDSEPSSSLDSSQAGSAPVNAQAILDELTARLGNPVLARYQLGQLQDKLARARATAAAQQAAADKKKRAASGNPFADSLN